MLELDLLVANEIAEQLTESAEKSKKKGKANKAKAKGAVARRDQRRATYGVSDAEKTLNRIMDGDL